MEKLSLLKNLLRQVYRLINSRYRAPDTAFILCKGDGVEVGPMSAPYRFHPFAKVRYADIAPPEMLREFRKENPIPGLYAGEIPPVDILLSLPQFRFPEKEYESYDFVYSSNVLEHHPNPIFFLLDQSKLLRRGGVLFVKIPNKKYMYDSKRATTTIEILEKKYLSEVFSMTVAEARDIIENTGAHMFYDILKKDVDGNAARIAASNDGTHHITVFDEKNTADLIIYLLKRLSHFSLEHFSARKNDNIEFALRRDQA
jgi:SAM-dependent methyltransferase